MATLYASADRVRREAAQLDPVKALLTVLLVVPFVLGYAVRLVWVVVALLWTGGVVGWRTAAEHIEARRTDAARGS